MACLCGIKECQFQGEKLKQILCSQKIIFTPINSAIESNEIFHIFMSGIRIINLDLSYGRKEDHIKMVKNINQAIAMFDNSYEFNEVITKICTIRGRTPRVGRMRNNFNWRLNGGELIVLTCDEAYNKCSCNEICFVSNFERFIPMLHICDTIASGDFELRVVKIVGNYVTCHVEKSGEIYSYQKLYLTQFDEMYHEIIDEEIQDCEFAIENNFDMIIAPDVRHAKYYHQLRRLIKGSEIKLIAKIGKHLDEAVVEKIVEHFHATFVKFNYDHVLSASRKFKKPIIGRFLSESCPTDSFVKMCKNADGFVLKSYGLKDTLLAVDKLNQAHNQESKVKAIVCVTNSGKALRNIDGFHFIIAITKEKALAKRLNLIRNVIAMVYVECGRKSYETQNIEMMKIALKFGKHMKLFVSEEPIIEKMNKT